MPPHRQTSQALVRGIAAAHDRGLTVHIRVDGLMVSVVLEGSTGEQSAAGRARAPSRAHLIETMSDALRETLGLVSFQPPRPTGPDLHGSDLHPHHG